MKKGGGGGGGNTTAARLSPFLALLRRIMHLSLRVSGRDAILWRNPRRGKAE